MGARKEVFISATSADLGSYRQVAKEAVLTLGAHRWTVGLPTLVYKQCVRS
jgi:hypothetical protein